MHISETYVPAYMYENQKHKPCHTYGDSPCSYGVLSFFSRTRWDRHPKRHAFYEKIISWRLYGDHGDSTAIARRPRCDYTAFAPRLPVFHWRLYCVLSDSTTFARRSHCDLSVYTTFSRRVVSSRWLGMYYKLFNQHMYHGSKEGLSKKQINQCKKN